MNVSYSDAEMLVSGNPTSGWIVAVKSDPPETNNAVTESVPDSTDHWQFDRPAIDAIALVYDNLIKIKFTMTIENSADEVYTAITQAVDALMNPVPVADLLTTHNDGSTSIVSGQSQRLFLDVFIEAPPGHPDASVSFPGNLIRPSSLSSDPALISPIDYRDTDTFYLLTAVHGSPTPIPPALTGSTPAHPRGGGYQPHTWRTDSVGGDTVASQQTGGSPKEFSTDSKGHNDKTVGYAADPGTGKPANPSIGGVAYFGTTIPNISMPKGRLSSAQGGTLTQPYGYLGYEPYDQAADNMAPVLHTVKVGRASHAKPAATLYDAHNFFELRYSEPVDAGSLSVPIANAQSQASFASASEYGGGISASGTTANVAGYFSYTGHPLQFYDFNSTSPSVKTLAPDKSSPAHDSLYRLDDWRLRVFLSGYFDAGRWPGWHLGIPEPVTTPPPPTDANATPALSPSPLNVAENTNIKDRAANPLNPYVVSGLSTLGTNRFEPFNTGTDTLFPPPVTPVDETLFTSRWDVDPPAFSFTELPDDATTPVTPGTHSAECEIIPVSLDGGLTVAKLDFFIQDNSRENDFATANNVPLAAGIYEWEPFAGGAQEHPDNRTTPRGVRDTTLSSGPNPLEAFKVGVASSSSRISAYNNSFESLVTHRYFLQGLAYSPNPTGDDPYFSLRLNANPWNPNDAFVLDYDHTQAHITDLAGNLLPSAGLAASLPLPAVDQVSPRVQISLAPVGENKLYIQFSEGLYHNFGNLRAPLAASDFILTGASVGIDTSVPLKVLQVSRTASPIPGVVKGVLSLTGRLTEKDVLSAQINFDPLVCDYRGNPFEAPGQHAISDIALGLVDPLWASDGYRFDSRQDLGDSVSTLKTPEDFTGKGRLHPSDVIMEARIKAPFISSPFVFNPDTAPLTLYYDADPKAYLGTDEVFSKMWLPLGIEGIVNAANTQARSTGAYAENGNLRDFLLPEADPENTGGNQMEFLYMLEAPDPINPGAVRLIPAARYERQRDYDETATDPLNTRPPFTVLPWSYQVTAPIVQRGGVSIYNNVINPGRGDKALLTYTLNRGGMVSVNIFSLDGSLVRALHRGTQAAGTYNFYWDGKNMGGRPVARGIYFVRVVGPNMDQIRKVMVVK
jgi:hypothetical protein